MQADHRRRPERWPERRHHDLDDDHEDDGGVLGDDHFTLADPRTSASFLLTRVRDLPRTPVLIGSFTAFAGVVLVDYLSGRDVTLAFLYVLPVLAAVWVGGRRVGFGFAIAAGVIGWLVSVTGSDDLPLVVTTWNALMRTAFYLLTAWLTAGLRSLVDYTTALSDHDGLTGLLNRRRFYEVVDAHLASRRRTGRKVAMLYLDLDHLKEANDSLGHEAGDELIQRFAGVLSSCARSTDVVARLGGDEFALFLPEADEAVAVQVATRLQRALRAQPVDRPLSASIGVAVRTAGSVAVESLVHAADEAMYSAKLAERGSIRIL